MTQLSHRSIEHHELISRRSLVKGGIAAAAVAVATSLAAREGGAAVTSMDSRTLTAPVAVSPTKRPAKK